MEEILLGHLEKAREYKKIGNDQSLHITDLELVLNSCAFEACCPQTKTSVCNSKIYRSTLVDLLPSERGPASRFPPTECASLKVSIARGSLLLVQTYTETIG